MWRSQPIFISSTFLDMQAERDHLLNFVFPALEELLKTRRCFLEWVDLRVGVANASEADAEARDALVLKVCLAEIRRCRPFLIVLLGDRYGWIPPDERIRAAASEEGVEHDPAGRSVTELEIVYGALSTPQADCRSFFYLREPLPYAAMSDQTRAKYNDSDGGMAGRLAELKARIEREHPTRVHHYPVQWDNARGEVTGLKAWGDRVLDDLWGALQVELPLAGPETPADWRDAERAALESFLEDRRRGFVGRRALLDRLTRFAAAPSDGAEPWAICVTGEAGSGKSALIGELARRLEGEDALVLAHAMSASPRAPSLASMLRRWSDDLAAARGEANPLTDAAPLSEVEAAFASLLRRAAARRRVVLLVDALDQIEASDHARLLRWLPDPWPEGARLVASAIPGQSSSALAEGGGAEVLPMPPLDAGEALAIARGICERYHRSFEPEVLDALVGKTGAEGPAWSYPLWLVLALEDLNLLDADDFARARTDYQGSAGERLRALMVDMVEAMPPTIPGAYQAGFLRAEAIFGAPLARAFLEMIALGRGGWRESDFRAVLPRQSGEPWDELRFASLRRLFRGQLRLRGELGQWDVSHGQMRVAIGARMQAVGASPTDLHRAIAKHLLSLPRDDPLRQSEAMFHLMASEDWAGAARFFGHAELSDGELDGAGRVLAERVTDARTPAAVQPLSQLLGALAPTDPASARLVRRAIAQVVTPLHGHGALDARRRFGELIEAACRRLVEADPRNLNRRHELSVSHLILGDLADEAGERQAARAAYEQALAESEALNAEAPRDLVCLHQILQVSQKLGPVMVDSGALAQAGRVYHQAIAIGRQLVGQEPDNPEPRRALAEVLVKQARLQALQGDLTAARSSADSARELAERTAAAHPTEPLIVRELASTQFCQAEIDQARGDLEAETAAIQAALDTLAVLVEMQPGNLNWRADVAVTLGRLADCQVKRLVPDAARRSFADAHRALARVVEADPANADWRRSLAIACQAEGRFLLSVGETARAGERLEEGLALLTALLDRDPANSQWVRDVAALKRTLADQRAAAGDLAGATGLASDALDLTRGWAKGEAENATAQRELARELDESAFARETRGDLAGAQSDLEASVRIIEGLAAADPENAARRRDLAAAQASRARLAKAMGDLAAAAQAQGAAVDILAEIARANPANPSAWLELAGFANLLADYQLSARQSALAAAAYAAPMAAFESAPAAQANVECARTAAALCLRAATLHNGLDAFPAAAASARAALSVAQRWIAADPADRQWDAGAAQCRDELAEALEGLGDRSGAEAMLSESAEAWDALTRTQPGATAWARSAARAWVNLARLRLQRGDLDAAEEIWDVTRHDVADLSERDPDDRTLLWALHDFLSDLGAAYVREEDWREAEAVIRAAEAADARLLLLSPRADAVRSRLVANRWNLAQLAHKRGDLATARACRAQALDGLLDLRARGVELDDQQEDILRRLQH